MPPAIEKGELYSCCSIPEQQEWSSSFIADAQNWTLRQPPAEQEFEVQALLGSAANDVPNQAWDGSDESRVCPMRSDNHIPKPNQFDPEKN
ncbi:hypothetical protein [Achromobacter insuavis]|uniref:hypothetical protein n=1 Tax=Achromobacter insuavis TaxID=1287735 RepID=UPI0015D2D271|nr:hypothetical protein [Achromobacter insuavis]